MPDYIKSISLVSLQFLFIGLLIFRSSLKNISAVASAFIVLSILLVIWATVAMQKSKLLIFPVPSPGAILITNGPYHFIRHPMYTAVLIGCMGLLINHFTWGRLVMFILLVIVLVIKFKWEEKMLIQKFDNYKNYMNHTSALIPFL